MDSVKRMDANLRDLFLYEAFLYFNPLLLVAMMIWLWGVNIWVFLHSSVNYAKVFDLDHNHLTHEEIWKLLCIPSTCFSYVELQDFYSGMGSYTWKSLNSLKDYQECCLSFKLSLPLYYQPEAPVGILQYRHIRAQKWHSSLLMQSDLALPRTSCHWDRSLNWAINEAYGPIDLFGLNIGSTNFNELCASTLWPCIPKDLSWLYARVILSGRLIQALGPFKGLCMLYFKPMPYPIAANLLQYQNTPKDPRNPWVMPHCYRSLSNLSCDCKYKDNSKRDKMACMNFDLAFVQLAIFLGQTTMPPRHIFPKPITYISGWKLATVTKELIEGCIGPSNIYLAVNNHDTNPHSTSPPSAME
eukprot:Gb_15994 [translate_table: standard]